MSLALVHSRARAGIAAPAVRVEVHLSGGLPSTQIVGLPEAAVRESRDRVRAAILCAQYEWPARRITINLGRYQGLESNPRDREARHVAYRF